MTKTILTFLALAIGILSASCQSNKYKIEVTGDALGQNDTLYLCKGLKAMNDIDTIVGVEGKYELEGTADSTVFGVLFAKRIGGLNVGLFIEPGTIKLNMSEKPALAKTSGTPCNDKWQELNDTLIAYGAQIDALAASIQQNKLSEQEQKAIEKKIAALSAKSDDFVKVFAKKNVNNEVGYFIISNYAPSMNDEAKAELVGALPEKFAKRDAIVALKKQMEQSKKTAVGTTLADYTMDDIDGKPTSILSLVKQNKLTVIDFWASWCGPCRAEMPTMVKMYADNKAKGLGIIGISLDNNKEKWAAAIKQLGITWPQLSDLKGWDNGFAKLFAVQGIPYTVVIDQQGKILKKDLRGAQLVEYVEEQLK